jgi:glyceraldehyde-3-phosphate dehydrogenase (NAD(P))
VKARVDEACFTWMVDNQAIVIPETIVSIRTLTGRERDGQATISRTNVALGIDAKLI